LSRADEALKAADRAIELQPTFFPAHSARGAILVGQGTLKEGLTSLDAHFEPLSRDPQLGPRYQNVLGGQPA
jgi:hypothetical protein